MSSAWQENIVRLCSSGGEQEALGTGTLVATGQNGLCILTCAHVLNAALGRDAYSPERPGDDADFLFDLPVRSRERKYHARILEWWPPRLAAERVAQPVGDIALLKIVSDIPQGVRPYSADDLVVDDLQDRLVRSFGFSRPGGEFTVGKLLGGDVSGWVHFAAESAQGPFVAPGFSGAPLFDDERKFIIGMVAAVEDDGDKRVAYALGTQLVWTACPPLARPYRGLRDFGERDRAFFFGRKAFVGRLCEKLKSHPIVGVAGASGSGKSSVVKAGLIPELRKERDWTILTMRPAANPWAELAREVVPLLHPGLSLGDRLGKEEELTEILRADPSHLGECLRRVGQAARSERVLVFVDQFEELFTQAGHEAEPAVDKVNAEQPAGGEPGATKRPDFRDLMIRTASLKGSPSIQWLYTLRADFAGQAYRHPAFVEALGDGEEKLADMNPTELRQSIVEPARKLEVDLEVGKEGGPSLSERIADAVEARPGSLPLMAHLLEKLWERLDQRLITHAAYDSLGGLEGALDRHADQVYEDLPAEQKPLARRLLSRLVKIEEGNEPTRRVRTRKELGEELWEVAGLLVNADSRLLVIRGTGEAARAVAQGGDAAAQVGRQTVEVAHEALLRNWGKFRTWLKEDLAFLLWRQRLEQRMEEYERLGYPDSQLLREEALTEANSWASTRPEGDFTKDQSNYIKQSNATASEDAKMAKEQADQRIRDAKDRIALLTRQRRWAVVALTLLGLFMVGGGYALYYLERLQAETKLQAENAEAAKGEAELQAEEARKQADVAKAERAKAEAAKGEAERHRKIAIANETRALSALAETALTNHRPIEAIKLGLAAWPRNKHDLRPQLETAMRSISDAMSNERLPHRIARHYDAVYGALVMTDGRILSWSRDNTLRLWDAATGAQVGPAMRHDAAVYGALVMADGRILSWSGDNTLRLWDAATGAQVGPAMVHDDAVYGALVMADGRILSWSNDNTLRLWDAATGAQVGPAMRHDDAVNGALVMADGRILSWSRDNTLRLWDAATGAQVGPDMRHDWAVQGAMEMADGRILSWSDDDTLRLWDAATGAQVGPAMRNDAFVNGALVIADGRILSWSNDNTLRLWDAATGAQVGPAMRHDDAVNGALVMADGRILSWSRDNTLRLWDAATGAQVGPDMRHDWAVQGAMEMADGRILSWSDDDTLRLWDAATGAQVGLDMHHDDAVYGALVMAGGRILSWSSDKTLRLWDAASAQVGPAMLHDDAVNGALVMADGRILSWSGDNTLRLWDAATGAQVGPAMRHDAVYGALVMADGRILSWSYDKTLRLWDAATGAQVGPAMVHDDAVYGALVMADGRILSWSGDNTLRLWDAATGAQVGPAMRHDAFVNGALVMADGRILSWSNDNTLRLWDTATGAQVGPAMRHVAAVYGALVMADGRILSWSYDNTLRLWDAATGAQVGLAMRHDDAVNGALVMADGRILSWSRDNTLRLWDAATSAQVGPAMVHDDLAYRALVMADGRILSWSRDNTLRLWDAATGAQVGPAMRHNDAVYGALVMADGRILSWSSDKTLRLWDAATGAQVGPAMRHDNDVYGALMMADGRILSWSYDNTLRLWNVDWPGGSIFEIACASLPTLNFEGVDARYGVKINEPICNRPADIPLPDWNGAIERWSNP